MLHGAPWDFPPAIPQMATGKNRLTGRAMVAHSGRITHPSQLQDVGGAIRAANQPNMPIPEMWAEPEDLARVTTQTAPCM